MERETGFEPATSTLARSHSTTELLPLGQITKNTVPQPLATSKTNRANGGSCWHRYLTSRSSSSYEKRVSFGVYKMFFAPGRNRHHIEPAGDFKGLTSRQTIDRHKSQIALCGWYGNGERSTATEI